MDKYRHPIGTWCVEHQGERYYLASEEEADETVNKLQAQRHCACGCSLYEKNSNRCAYCEEK